MVWSLATCRFSTALLLDGGQDMNLYSMKLINRNGGFVSIGTVKNGVGQCTILPLSHEEPLRVGIEF
jgi:hypothetical protein